MNGVNVPRVESTEPACTIQEDNLSPCIYPKDKLCGDVCLESYGTCHCGNESFQVEWDKTSVCCAKIGACKKFYEKSGKGKECHHKTAKTAFFENHKT